MTSTRELRGNRAIENAAIAWVMDLERGAGREPKDTRYRGAPADIESPPRLIEVKAVGKESCRGEFLWLETPQVEEGLRNPDFFVYVVENVRQGDPALFRLKVYGGQQLQRLLAGAREKRYFEVPVPVAEYDRAGNDGLAAQLEIAHVHVRLEPALDGTKAFGICAEAGYPDTEEVVALVAWEPDELAEALDEVDTDPSAWRLDWVLWHLADALAEEGVVMTVAELLLLADVAVPPGYPPPN
jgi:hypothetical protein